MTNGAPQIVRSRFSSARFGCVLVDARGRVEDNEFVGIGEMGLTLVGGAPWVHRNSAFFLSNATRSIGNTIWGMH